jgi:hypothetical protein
MGGTETVGGATVWANEPTAIPARGGRLEERLHPAPLSGASYAQAPVGRVHESSASVGGPARTSPVGA